MELTQQNLFIQIKEIIDNSRKSIYYSVNSAMVKTYWNIGRLIVEEEQKGSKRADYGKLIIKSLSEQLTKEFGKGFGVTNLKYFKQFFVTFPKGHALRGELSWTHYRLLMRVKNEKARDYYIEESVSQGWSSRALDRQINSLYFERLLSSKKKEALKVESKENTKKLKVQPEDILKDPYILEFCNLKEKSEYLERDLEAALIDKLQDFLLELGKGFCFVARQKRIPTGTGNFYIDLVFYNYVLNCFVLIDLKTNKLTHQDIGQMDMYVRLFEEKVKPEKDNPTLGIILCTHKDETIVKFSILKESKQIFTSKYQLFLPSEKELIQEIEREKKVIKLEKLLNEN
jgi:predicted nuclease of restriction endonuclease-like (RecB) superfamily